MAHETLLDRIDTPHQLRRLSDGELARLADELRERIVAVVSRTGGHLASNLGVADLTIALHHVFDFSRDRLLWDVGHQCYAHKMLTGRSDRFDTLRQEGGISGFPAPSESPYDVFATGHAGTAISTASGLAWAQQLAGTDDKIVAVVGDASVVNGLALEGINNLSLIKRQFLVVLNDNSMAIDRTCGAMAKALDRIRLTHVYSEFKHSTESFLHHLPLGHGISDALRKFRDGVKTTLHGRQVFDAWGLRYFGPIDGHNIPNLIRVLERLGHVDEPVLLHIRTQKGRGCQYAVEDPCRFHSPSAHTVHNAEKSRARSPVCQAPSDRAVQGQEAASPVARPTWTQTFSRVLVEVARRDERVIAITAAMPDGTGLSAFREVLPDRYIDVGISESHAVAMAAGQARAGLRPVVAVYSTFIQRAMDQIFHDVCLQHLPVVLCMDRAGLVGSDGAVHHGTMDVAMLRTMPGMVLMAPADASELGAALEFALSLDGPAGIRYPRDEVPADLPGPCRPFELGKARVICRGDDGTFLCYGATVESAIAAVTLLERDHGLNVGIVNARFAKPLDVTLIARVIGLGKPVVVCEDHAAAGGFGSAVLELAAERGLDASRLRLMGLPDRFIAHASRLAQLVEAGLDATHLAATMTDFVDQHAGRTAPDLM